MSIYEKLDRIPTWIFLLIMIGGFVVILFLIPVAYGPNDAEYKAGYTDGYVDGIQDGADH